MTFAIEDLDARRHDRGGFDCGIEPLNRYLKSLAGQHRIKGIATSFVLIDTDRPTQILGYYSLSAASLAGPAVRIGRLATSISVRGQGLGELLLQNAIKRTLQARTTLGVCAVIVEAKDAAAESFYRKYGFRLCDPQTRQLYLPLGARDVIDAWPHNL